MKICTNQERLNELFDADPRSLTAIAQALGVSKQAVSMWRTGERSPKKSMLVKISQMFNVSIEWLMGFDVDKNGSGKKAVIIPDLETFNRILLHMAPLDYEVFMDILERTQEKMRQTGDL